MAQRPKGKGRQGNGVASRNILYVCRTCPRYEPPPPLGEPRRGEQLAARIKTLAENGRFNSAVRILVVNCLSGCPNPCNVSLGAIGKTRLRFSRLAPEDAQELLAAAALYADSADGELAPEQLPAALRSRLTARSPTPRSDGPPGGLVPGRPRLPTSVRKLR